MIKEQKEIRFGVAGFPPAFFESRYKKKRENIFEWLNELNLDWIELQNTYGVKMKEEQAVLYRELAEKYKIGISLHAPYFITLASADDAIVQRSKERILQCFELAVRIGSKRIVFHPGHFPGKSEADRMDALKRIVDGLNSIKNKIPKGIYLYPETAGKHSQIGSVNDIIYICSRVEYTRPCIDVAHVHGFENGKLTTSESIIEILNLIEKELGRQYLEETHFHMYPVEIDRNGEKRHRAFEDRIENQQLELFSEVKENRYYPLAEHFVEAIKYKGVQPVIICEARDSQERGARMMKDLYLKKDGAEG
ncbi:MAG: TIM barrel protein [Lachnospiraceae bacterium]|nr:TIM barrel protein [Lachnospiraceae bacterium]